MGQVNVNTPGGATDPDGSSGAGFILGIIVAIIVIAALVYFLVLAPGNNGGGTTNDGGGDGGNAPAPSGWMLTHRA
jgi:peptidoglycan/LPS O-acetylase OafA/YrhL